MIPFSMLHVGGRYRRRIAHQTKCGSTDYDRRVTRIADGYVYYEEVMGSGARTSEMRCGFVQEKSFLRWADMEVGSVEDVA